MKHALLILTALVACSFAAPQPAPDVRQSGTVYICTGPQSKRYHKTSHCRGLASCSAEIEAVSIAKAKSLGRTPCGICYR